MKFISFITVLQLVMINVELQQDEVCLSCKILEECEEIVCSNIPVNGTFVPEYVIGCELACPFGKISCQKNEDNSIAWSPSDPCAQSLTTTTITTTTTTTDTSPLTTLNIILDSTTTLQLNVTSVFNDSNESFIRLQSTPTQNVGTDLPIDLDKYVGLSKSWTLFWLIPLILFITLPTLFLCCLVIHHFHKKKGKVKFPLSKKHTVDILDPSASSWTRCSQPYTLGTLIGQNGQYTQEKSMKRESSESPTKCRKNGHNTNDVPIPKYSKFRPTKQSMRRRVSPSLNRRLINWQDSGIHDFAIPPSPKFASTMNMSKTSLNYSTPGESSSQTPLYLRSSSSHILSETLPISSQYTKDFRSVSQCSMLFPQRLNLQDKFSTDYDFHDSRTITTFNPPENCDYLGYSINNNHYDRTVVTINDEDIDDANGNTSDQVSSITLQPITQQINSEVHNYQPFNAFTDIEHENTMYDSNYNDWTIGETTIQRIPRI
ncbi:unnamed protein product [Heterobilharzia americana]|nr:unnamed protein product [Heterobilharzia americana]